MFIRLSYDLAEDAPGWPGNPTMQSHRHTSIEEGDIVNHTVFTLFTHFGTHLDAPLHWQQAGDSVTDLSIDHFIYEAPVVVDIPKDSEEFVTQDEATKAELERLTPLQRIGRTADIAAAVVYLASEAGSFLTGKVLEVDGGLQEPNLDLRLPDLEAAQ